MPEHVRIIANAPFRRSRTLVAHRSLAAIPRTCCRGLPAGLDARLTPLFRRHDRRMRGPSTP